MRKRFNEWMMIWVVFAIMAGAILFQMLYISHIKSELKLFRENDKNTHTKSR